MGYKKSLGQHFLHEQTVIADILAAALVQPQESVLEVGPGAGALTEGLAVSANHLVLLEADRDLLAGLRDRFPKADVHFGDAAKMPIGELMRPCAPWVFVSNLPYNAGNAILMNVFAQDPLPERLVVMVQKEVGDRMLYRDPEHRGVFGVAVNAYATVEKVRLVAPGAFTPPPAVDSMVLCLVPRAGVAVRRQDIERMIRVAKVGFANRRKKLSRNLEALGVSRAAIADAFAALGLSLDARAQDLEIAVWERLTALLFADHVAT